MLDRRKLDTLLLVALSGVWCLCFVLHLNQLARGGFAWIPIYIDPAPSESEYPTLRSFWSGAQPLAPDLAVGDRLVSVGDRDLRGSGRIDFIAALYALPANRPIAVTALRGSESIAAGLSLQEIPNAWRKSIVALAFAALGMLGFWRTRGSSVGRAYFLVMMAYAFHWTDFWGGTAATTQAAIAVFGVSTALTAPLALRVCQVFPEEVARPGSLSKGWPWLFLAIGPLFTSWAFGLPFPLPRASTFAVGLNAVYVATLVALLTRNYRASGALGRRQLKWVVLGFWLGLVPVFVTSMLALAAPELWWLYEASLGLTIAIPICLFVALTRFNLFDVDRLLTAAATYSLVGTLALGGVFLIVPRASSAASGWIEPDVSQPMMALLLGGVAFFGLRSLDKLLQSRLHPERAALQADAARLRQILSDCEKPVDVLTELGVHLRALLQLETIAVYARTDRGFAPVFAGGPGVHSSFELEGPLAVHLDAFREPLIPSRMKGNVLERADWAALASMGIELVLPIAPRDVLEAFVCLGSKGSGDVFTASDNALLLGLTDKAADELQRFAHAEIERQNQQLADELRRFVPGAVVRELDEGFRLAPGERDVSVLFVDIRGYTPFSEGLQPSQIFAAVSQYTEVVSEIVSECGGSVVEFHGDGLMAVFGAPRPLDDKEACAVRAAREISFAIPKLDVRGADGRPHRLDVGVGVATGPAYVGPLKTADRTIWVALGNTSNLAARLESATRDLDVALVIDTPTHAAAKSAAAGFEARPGLRVKGRSAPIDVFTWSRDMQEVSA